MPRVRRWDRIISSFRSGILSPAQQDNVQSAVYTAGAADILNFDIGRDGGLSGREYLRHHGIEIPVPNRDVVLSWEADAQSGGAISGPSITTGSDLVFNREDNVHLFSPTGISLTVAANPVSTTTNLLTINLASFRLEDAARPFSIIFRDVWLQGISSWEEEAAQVGGHNRLSFKVVGTDFDDTDIEFAADPSPSEDEDPYGKGTFVPGKLPRDIVVDLTRHTREVKTVSLRLAHGFDASTNNIILHMRGVSCYDYEGTDQFYLLDDPVNFLEWPIGDRSFILAVGMDWFSVWEITDDGPVHRAGDTAETKNFYHFTEKQVMGLDYALFQSDVVIAHKEFPPLHVQLPRAAGEVMRVTPLALEYLLQLQESQIPVPVVETIDTGLLDFPVFSLESSGTPGRVNVRVVQVPGATKYDYRYNLRGAQPGAPLSSGMALSIILTGLMEGSTYEVQVRVTAPGLSAAQRNWSRPRTITVPVITPAAPQNFAVTSPRTGIVRFSYDLVVDATSYQIEWRVKGDTAWTSFSLVARDTDHTGTWAAGSTLEFRIRTIKGSLLSPYSDTVEVTVRGNVPPAPVLSFVKFGNTYSYDWNAIPGVLDYTVARVVNYQLRDDRLVPIYSTIFTTTLSVYHTINNPGELAVRARNVWGSSPWSNVAGSRR